MRFVTSLASSKISTHTTTLLMKRNQPRGRRSNISTSTDAKVLASAKSTSSLDESDNAALVVVNPPNRKNRIRRYIVLVSSSTVLYLAFSFLIASSVPSVNGGARFRASSNDGSNAILCAVNMFRLRPWTNRNTATNRSRRRQAQVLQRVDTSSSAEFDLRNTMGTSVFRRSRFTRRKIRILHHPYNRKRKQVVGSNCFLVVHTGKRSGSITDEQWTCLRGGSSSSAILTPSTTAIHPVVILNPLNGHNFSEWEFNVYNETTTAAPLVNHSVVVQHVHQEQQLIRQDQRLPKFTVLSGFVCSSALLSFLPQPEFLPAQQAPDDHPAVGDTENSPVFTNAIVEDLDSSSSDTIKTDPKSKYQFSVYQKGDGSEDDEDHIPTRYLKMHMNNREKAKLAFQETLQWRIENDIDTIIGRPHPDFDVCKAVFPHAFVGHDKHGNVAFVQRPALLNLELAKKNGLTNHGLLNHYIYVNEYMWQIIEAKRPLATMTSIIDLQGLNLSVLRQGDIVSFLKIFVKTMDSHFPQRANMTMLVNAPKWFNMLYKLLSPLLRETTKEKIIIYSNGPQQDEALKQQLHADSLASLPLSFWSNDTSKTNPTKHDTRATSQVSELEHELREFTVKRLMDAGMEMQPVLSL